MGKRIYSLHNTAHLDQILDISNLITNATANIDSCTVAKQMIMVQISSQTDALPERVVI